MYYDFYTEDKIIEFITKTQLFTNYAFSHAISAEKLKMQISNYNSSYAKPYDTLQKVNPVVRIAISELPFDKICCLILADICQIPSDKLEILAQKKLSFKKADELLTQMLNEIYG